MKRLLALVMATTVSSGCAKSYYVPYGLEAGELYVTQDGGLKIADANGTVALEPGYAELVARVGCDADADEHARQARRHGRVTRGLGVTGAAMGIGSLAAFAGIPFIHDEPKKAAAIIGTSLGIGLVGLGLALGSRRHRVQANGHAVDAVNYYNDALTRSGSRCRPKAPPPRWQRRP